MLRRISAFSLLLVLLLSASALAIDFQTKPKLAFYPLLAKNVDAIVFTERVSTQLFNSIERTDYFEILERKKVESAIQPNGVPLASMSKASLFAVCTKSGFDLLILGDVKRVDNAALVNIQVVGSASRNSYYADTFRIPDFEVPEKVKEIAERIVAQVKVFNIAPAPAETSIPSPADLTISGTPKSIKLLWSPLASKHAIGYAILRAKTATGSFVQIATTTGTTYTDGNLKLNDTFYYKVKGISRNGMECELSEAAMGKTSLAPSPPIFMEITPDVGSVLLTWYGRPYAGSDRSMVNNGFRIYRKLLKEGDYRLIAKVGPEALSYVDKTLKEGVVYSYRLASHNADGIESEFSSAIEASLAKATSNIQAASGGMRKVQLSWTPSDSKTVAEYSVYRSRSNDRDFKKIAQVGSKAGSYADSGLEDASTYWYRIAANLVDNTETPQSAAVSATTRARPAPPAGLSAAGDEPRRVTLKWQSVPAPDGEMRGYNLFRAAAPGEEFVKIAEIPYGKNSYVDDRQPGTSSQMSRLSSLVSDGSVPLSDGATFHYRISCFNAVGSESLPSEKVSATTRVKPAAPMHVAASTGQVRMVSLKWDKSPEARVQEYVVYRGPFGQSEVERLKSTKEPFFLDTSLPDGAAYVYAVKASDADNIESPLSSPVTGTTKAPPAIPKMLVVTKQSGLTGIRWEPNTEKDLARYVVYKAGFMGLFLKLQTVDSNFLPLDGIKGKLELRIAAEDADGLESGKSDSIVVELN